MADNATEGFFQLDWKEGSGPHFTGLDLPHSQALKVASCDIGHFLQRTAARTCDRSLLWPGKDAQTNDVGFGTESQGAHLAVRKHTVLGFGT